MCVKCDLGHPEACDNAAPPTYPPQCFRCSKFVNVKTARKVPEYGEYGALLNMEFECAKCVAERLRAKRTAREARRGF